MFFVSAPSVYPATIHLGDDLRKQLIGRHVEFLVDESGGLSIEDVSRKSGAGSWHASNDINPGFGFTESVYWVRFTVANDTTREISLYLEHEYPLVDTLEMFLPQPDGTYRTVKTGDRYMFSERPVEYRTFVFPLVCEARSTKTFYLRQKTSSAMNFPLILWSPAEFKKMSVSEERLLMFYYGMMVIMVFNYLFIYLLIRHASYLNFALFILSILLFIMTQVGATFQFIMPNNPGLASICPPLFLCMANLFGNRFIAIFLQLKKNAPVFRKIIDAQFLVFLIALASVVTIPLFGQYKVIMTATSYLSVVTIMLAFIIGLYLAARKQRSAYLFALIGLGFLFGSILYLLKTFGLMPGNFIATWSMVIGSATILIFLSIAMVDRINTMRKGLKIVSQNLEKQVKERSIELLLTETAAKVMEVSDARAGGAGNETIHLPSIQNLLNNQRDLTINKLSQDIRIISNMDEFFAKTGSRMMEMAHAARIYLFELNDAVPELRSFIDTIYGDSQGYSAVIVDRVVTTALPVVNYDDTARGIGADDRALNDGARPVMAVPMVSNHRVIGVCYLERSDGEAPFSEKEVSMVTAFIDTIIPVFENAISYRKKMLKVDDRYTYSITSQTEEKIRQAIAYIEVNYTEDISRENLAASLDISPNHLGKFFKVHTGKKINEYINELRISDAARKLREQKNENIINIAFSVGFESLSTFNRAFLKVMGVTPTEYKEQNKP